MKQSPQYSATSVAGLKSLWKAGTQLSLRLFSLVSLTLMLSGCAHQPLRNLHDHLTFLNPQGPIAAAERWHFWFVILVMGVLVAGPVYLITIWLLYRYRYSNKANTRYAPKWGHNRVLGVLTWSGPVAIVIFLGIFVWRNAHQLDPFKPLAATQPALQVEAIGYDWKWLFVYPKQGIATIGVLPIPAGRPVAMKLTSATVMQSLSIPALVGQIYAMGGMVTQLHFKANGPGRSLGMNTMYNGPGFARQTFTTVALKPGDFNAWVKRVQSGGVVLDHHTYALLSKRSTKGRLATALKLPTKMVNEGHVYLRDVPAHLFRKVIRATASGTPINLNHYTGTATGMHMAIAAQPVAKSKTGSLS